MTQYSPSSIQYLLIRRFMLVPEAVEITTSTGGIEHVGPSSERRRDLGGSQ